MNILVCLKQILDPEIPARDFRVDAIKREAERGSATLVTNIFCENALETALQLRERAADLVYNLDRPEAIRLLRQAIAADPGDTNNHRALASAIWLEILFKRGAVTVDHYLGSFTKTNVDVKDAPGELDAEFKRTVAKAIELAEKRGRPRHAIAGAFRDRHAVGIRRLIASARGAFGRFQTPPQL